MQDVFTFCECFLKYILAWLKQIFIATGLRIASVFCGHVDIGLVCCTVDETE